MSNSSNTSSGIGVVGLLGVVFVTLKLCGVIAWPWWLVTLPFWGDSATVVLAHFRLSGTCGVGMKPPDLLGAHACSNCHDAIDRRIHTNLDRDYVRLAHAEGVMRTIDWLIGEGAI